MTAPAQGETPRSPGPAARRYRALWAPDLAALLALAAVAALLSSARLDIAVARLFFSGEPGPAGWPLHLLPAAVWLRRVGPWPAALSAACAAAYLVRGALRRSAGPCWPHCVCILLAVALGPGLVINAGLKQHWGRPRPRETVAFGGQREFRPAFVRSPGGQGNSFACGEGSMGYTLSIFYFLLRRRRRGLRLAALAFSVILGSAVGFVRMIAGAHFLSDVLWSGVLVGLVNAWLYYGALRVPQREDAAPARAPCAGPGD
jgi:membrane-associated PAP2 superfamily phosphatase